MASPFPFEQNRESRWVVYLDGETVVVQTRTEAGLLASIPVEHARLKGDEELKPDASRVRQILSVAKRYGYSSRASQELAAWLASESRKTQNVPGKTPDTSPG